MNRGFATFDGLIDVWFAWMAAMSWQVAVLVVVLAGFGFLLRWRSARFRYGLWTLVPIRLVLPPTLALATGWGWWILPGDPQRYAGDRGTPQLSADASAAGDGFEHAPGFDRLLAGGVIDGFVQQSVQSDQINQQAPQEQPSLKATAGGVTAAKSGPKAVNASSPEAIAAAPVKLAGAALWKRLLFAAWLAGGLVLAGRLAGGYQRVRRLRSDAEPADPRIETLLEDCRRQLKLHTRVSVKLCPSAWTPMVTGFVRPVILMPPTVGQKLTDRELRAVLFHELQHVARRDVWQELLLVVVQVAYFFHPCVWWSGRQLRRLREQACDEATVAMLTGNRGDYGSGMVKVAELLTQPTPRWALGIVDSDEQVASRLRRILDPRLPVGRGLSWASLLFLVLLGLVLIPSAARRVAVAQSPAENVTSQESVGEPLPPTRSDSQAVTQSEDAELPGDKAGEVVELTGRVLDREEDPVVHGTVQVAGWSVEEMRLWKTAVRTDDKGAFRLRVRLDPQRLSALRISATNSDGTQLGLYRFPESLQEPAGDGMEIRLSPVKVARLRVVDATGEPIANASAAIHLGYPFKPSNATTDGMGIATFEFPETERIESVVAWKNHRGLDYRLYALPRQQRADTIAAAPAFPADGQEQLVLDGASPLTLRVLDDDQQPIEGVRLSPWLLKKDSEADRLNMSFFLELFTERTDADGTATFAWIPTWQKDQIVLWPSSSDFVRERLIYDVTQESGKLEVELNRLVAIRGHVRHANGEPAAGIEISASGAGYTLDRGSASSTTDKEGAYELRVPPDQLYLVLVKDLQWAAAPHTGFAVLKNQPVEDKDFTLRPATRVHGTLVSEESHEPIPNEIVYVYQYGKDLNDLESIELPNPENSRRRVQPLEFFRAHTDDRGRFEFSLGDGNFDIRPPQQEKADKFQISGEAELELQVTSKVHQDVELVGIVRDEVTGKALPGARIKGVPREFRSSDWQATTNQDGKFLVKRREQATYIHAVSADNRLAAIANVEPKQTEIALSLSPVATVMGRLLRRETGEAWGDQVIEYAFNVPSESGQSWSPRFGGHVTTAADGTFRIEDLVPGHVYHLHLERRDDRTSRRLTRIRLAPGESSDLGDLQAPLPRQSAVPPRESGGE